MNKNKIVMPKRLLNKWLRALRSGKYKQVEGTLYSANTKGYCCLGVLEHCAMNGMVECDSMDAGAEPLAQPSRKFYRTYGIKMPGAIESVLIGMNDGYYGVDGKNRLWISGEKSPDPTFKDIAKYIKENSVGV